ncbi:MAG: DUF3143 domain-containing protein [Xenococcaceae cyanobacterium MO_188.B29]|nr:DUF3143 domain-containing protein [Xenococcaceae cyanobacterium MO_188.B29]
MVLPDAQTPLYSHPLPDIEKWLAELGCRQDKDNLHCWHVEKPDWKAEICLEIEELTVRYFKVKEAETISYSEITETKVDLTRSFKYSLSRQDIEAAVFSGP